MTRDDSLKTMCPRCEVVRWHDRESEGCTCRGCGYTSTQSERHEVRTAARLDDLSPDLKDGSSGEDAQSDLSGWVQ